MQKFVLVAQVVGFSIAVFGTATGGVLTIARASCGGRDGGASDVPQEALLRHKEQQGPEGQNTRCSQHADRVRSPLPLLLPRPPGVLQARDTCACIVCC